MQSLTLNSLLPANTNYKLEIVCTYVGIDFGTSTTVVSVIEKQSNEVIATPLQISQKYPKGSTTQDTRVPTCLAYSTKRSELYVGAGAYEARFDPRLESGKNVWFEFKTLLGEDVGPRYANSVLDGKEGRPKLENAIDATSAFLAYVREEVEKEIRKRNLPPKIMWAVSVPASFEANQRKDLIDAMKQAGIENIGESLLIDEPNAAFLSYVEQSNRLRGQRPLAVPDGKPISVLVFDFGAGTCDISVLQFQQDDFSGVSSKNVAISHYSEIGGKDIDKLIAERLVAELQPVETSTPKVSELPLRVKERLTDQLLRIAEELKIELCKQIAFHSHGRDLNELSSSIGLSPELKDHQNRVYLLPKIVKLTYQNMTDIISQFTEENKPKSIFIPIKSALKSAGLTANQIDYILFVGGSSKNPWIQNVVKAYFPDSDYLFPEDMQTLVSQGAAIHSYYFNGLKHKLIKPITGPTITLRMANGEMRTLVPSGTEIPYAGVTIENLHPQNDGQKAIELPICLTSDTHILQNLKIEPEGKSTFSVSDNVSLSVKITADKTLYVAAKVSSGELVVAQMNPYSSKALSTRERIAAEGRKKFNQSVRKNGGVPSSTAFLNLSIALEKAAQNRESAEMKEEAFHLNNSSTTLNNLGAAWHKAGDHNKAADYFRLSADKDDAYGCVNLAVLVRWSNPAEYRKLITKAYSLQPNNDWVLYNYGKMLKTENNEEWKTHWNTCLAIYMNRLAAKTITKEDTDRAIEVATALEKSNEEGLLKLHKKTFAGDNDIFMEDNTVTSSTNSLRHSTAENLLNF